MKNTPDPTIIPGNRKPPTPPLQRYRSSQLPSVIHSVISDITKPGDLVLHMAASTSTYVRETVNAERRILSINVNPIPLTWMHLELSHPPKSTLSALLTRLGDIPKENRPFIRYVETMYQSSCPRCGQPGIAEWFVWDRETNQPHAKRVRCYECHGAYEGPVTSEDIANAERFAPESGPAYYMALGRAANPDDPGRARAAELVKLYTPRNLSLLFDILNRRQRLDVPDQLEKSLTGLILEALDQGSRLIAASDPHTRPRSLRPARYHREQNVWFILEALLETLDSYPRALSNQAWAIQDLLMSPEPGFALSTSSLYSLIRSGNTQRFDALILEIQPPDAVFWALSALWSVWLWRDLVQAPIGGFLNRRRLTWEWYTRGLSVGLIQAKQLLRPHAFALCILDDEYVAATEALARAIKRSEFQMRTWVGDSDAGYYVLLQSEEGTTHHPIPPLSACESTISKRCEPTSEEHLKVAALLISGGEAIKLQELERESGWIKMERNRWWMSHQSESETPLADRIERAVIKMLTDQPTWQRTAMIQELYHRFNKETSPELSLVETCLEAYTETREAMRSDQITLRDEDDPVRRWEEMHRLREALAHLGQRLCYQTRRTESRDILWTQEGEIHHRFRCIATAILTPHLSSPPKADRGQCYLVVPGGRAALIHLKLRRDPRLPRWLKLHHWQFIKFRHLRRMAREVENRSDIEVYLGLDPIVEQAQAQIPLPLKAERDGLR